MATAPSWAIHDGRIHVGPDGKSYVWSQADSNGPGNFAYVSPEADHTGTAPTGSFFQNRGTFNQNTGEWDQGANWTNILSLVAGGMLTAGAASAMMGGAVTPEAITEAAAAQGGGAGAAGGGAAAGGGGAAAGGGGGASTFLSAAKTGSTGYGILKALVGGSGAGGNGPSVASSLATTAGSIEAQRAAALVAAARTQQVQDELAQRRAELALKAPRLEASNAVRGDVLANAQDVHITAPSTIPVPTITGGLRPSMFSDATRQLGGVMSRNALAHQLSGDDVPNLTPLPKAGTGDTALQYLGYGAGFLNALQPLLPGGGGRPGTTPPGPGYGAPGGYGGPGTPGYPGDGVSPINNPIPPIENTDEFDPSLDWWDTNG